MNNLPPNYFNSPLADTAYEVCAFVKTYYVIYVTIICIV